MPDIDPRVWHHFRFEDVRTDYLEDIFLYFFIFFQSVSTFSVLLFNRSVLISKCSFFSHVYPTVGTFHCIFAFSSLCILLYRFKRFNQMRVISITYQFMFFLVLLPERLDSTLIIIILWICFIMSIILSLFCS